jgi:hypothetical protein
MWTHLFWTYIVGPLAALLPAPWRRAVSGFVRVDWARAALLSGFLEILAAIISLGYWYMFDMTRRMTQITDAVATGQVATGASEHQVSGAALTFFYLDFLTWILFYVFLEGVVRLCGAAFTENVMGTLPLYLLERMLFLFRNRKKVKPGEVVSQNVNSFVESLRERLLVSRLEQVPDELHYMKIAAEQMLEISASRRKEDWVPPKIIRVDETFYRLEDTSVREAPRPFHYRLRRLEAGVTGRNVILYKTGDLLVKE